MRGRSSNISTSSKGWGMKPDANTAVSASASVATNIAPSVTVLTNIAGAVSVKADQAGIDAGRRLRLKLLPENLFNPFRGHHRRCISTRRNDAGVSENPPQNLHEVRPPLSSSSAAAAIAAEGIKAGVSEELDRWALQTSRRESMVLWRHECSRYASSSRIGYHPNHPSASHPGSRPSSAATILRPFSAGRAPQQRASSAVPPGSLPIAGGQVHNTASEVASLGNMQGRGGARPRSAIPRLGVPSHAARAQDDDVPEKPRPARGVSASGRGGASSSGGDVSGRGYGGAHESARGLRAPARSPMQQDAGSIGEDMGELYDDIYEDLDDEDDGELDNRISIMESRFSTVGREKPISAVRLSNGSAPIGDDVELQRCLKQTPAAPRSARRLLRPPQQTSGTRETRRLVSADAYGPTKTYDIGEAVCLSSSGVNEAKAPRVIKSRPTSAPANGSLCYQRGMHDPVAALRARRLRLQLSSAGAEENRLVGGGVTAQEEGVGYENQQQRGRQQGKHSYRNVTTAVPSWDRETDAGNRPLSSATAGAAGVYEVSGDVDGDHGSSKLCRGRPSSAAFRRWVEARPSAMLSVSAVSSSRTLGMDDSELIHLQLEMESRRGGMSEATLARMEDHYNACMLKDDTSRSQSSTRRNKQGRFTSPRTKSAAGGAKSPRKGASTGPRKAGPKGTPRSKASAGSRSRSPKKGNAKKNAPRSGGKGGASRRGRINSNGGRKGKDGKGSVDEGLTPRKVYPSARAFVTKHFPAEEKQGVSLLGMEQEQECRRVSDALSRAGISIPRAALHRALVIPTDRPLEACLAGLPLPMEGLRDKPFPTPPRLPVAAGFRQESFRLSGYPLGSLARGRATSGDIDGAIGRGGITRAKTSSKRSKSPGGKRGKRAVVTAVASRNRKAAAAAAGTGRGAGGGL